MCQIQNIQENLENADFYHNKDSFWTYMVHNQLLSSIWHLYLYCVTKKWWYENFDGVCLRMVWNFFLSITKLYRNQGSLWKKNQS